MSLDWRKLLSSWFTDEELKMFVVFYVVVDHLKKDVNLLQELQQGAL